MRTREEVRLVARLAAEGLGISAVARESGVPASTVARWLAGGAPRFRSPDAPSCPRCRHARHDSGSLDAAAYSYVLGLYLGDGHVARFPRTHCLRIYLDTRYPGIIAECVAALERVLPDNRATAITGRACTVVQCYSGQWPCLLPQHGPGYKHDREIALEPWQRALTRAHPGALLRGLIHSDGSRFLNPVRRRGRTYRYPRYLFSNVSEDIKAIFCEHLDQLGVQWRRAGTANISIARREAVAKLDAFVGPKR
jgi:hypothetical protein